MKLPRWLVVSMLAASSLAMFMFAAWWWVTWPERTLERFLEYGRAGKWDKANGMCDDKVWVNVASIDDKTRDECCEFFAALRSLEQMIPRSLTYFLACAGSN